MNPKNRTKRSHSITDNGERNVRTKKQYYCECCKRHYASINTIKAHAAKKNLPRYVHIDSSSNPPSEAPNGSEDSSDTYQERGDDSEEVDEGAHDDRDHPHESAAIVGADNWGWNNDEDGIGSVADEVIEWETDAVSFPPDADADEYQHNIGGNEDEGNAPEHPLSATIPSMLQRFRNRRGLLPDDSEGEDEDGEALGEDADDSEGFANEGETYEPAIYSEETRQEIEESQNAALNEEEGIWGKLTMRDRLNRDFRRSAVENAQRLDQQEMNDIRAFNYKVDTLLKDNQYYKLSRAFPGLPPFDSLYRLHKSITRLSGIKPVPYDCCINSCLCYTGRHRDLTTCPFPDCGENRFVGTTKIPRKRFYYLPLVPRLTTMFMNPEQSRLLQTYRNGYEESRDPNVICDIFDGDIYQELRERDITIGDSTLPVKYFADDRDIALGISFDGFCPFKRRKQTCWPIILFNYNIPPTERFKLDNILSLGVIPGPKQMKDTDSFLEPFVEEMISLSKGVKAFDSHSMDYFILRAFLVLGFGDIPAIAKLMRMKGANALKPCRLCPITAHRVPDSRSTTHYVSLLQPNSEPINPLDINLRTRAEFMQQAQYVADAESKAEGGRRAKETGIKGVPILSCLDSLSFPHAFPPDFMHVIWENVIPQLVDLWCGEYKGLDEGGTAYTLAPTVIDAIGEGIIKSGATIPTAFGCRTPSFVTERYQYTAEAWSQWTMLLAPVLLRRRFRDNACYEHFIKLVALINQCLDLSITRDELVDLKVGFADWVQTFERLYLQGDMTRLSLCTLPIHYLLHIADSISMCGPVWCYWAFPMERYCGSLLPAITSRRYPFRSLDRRITELAQLSQIKLLYQLHEQLDLTYGKNIENSAACYEGYEELVFAKPKDSHFHLSTTLKKKIAEHIQYRLEFDYGGKYDDVKSWFPSVVVSWGKMKWKGGDMIRGCELAVSRSHSRDASHIKYQVLEDRNRSRRNMPVEMTKKILFGQVQRFLVIPLTPSPHSGLQDMMFILAVVKPCKLVGRWEGKLTRWWSNGTFYADQVIDISVIECLVGRVLCDEKQVFVEKPGAIDFLGSGGLEAENDGND